MKCPHCQTKYHGNPVTTTLRKDAQGQWAAVDHLCPECGKAIIFLVCGSEQWSGKTNDDQVPGEEKLRLMGYPRTGSRPAPHPDVPNRIAEDFQEACLVLSDSPKASAALSRRCRQHLLREKVGVRHANLVNEIEQAMAGLPTHLAVAIDAIRQIGNFAAHPQKDTATGSILPVEMGEAEWLLDVLEQLFDFYCVQPALTKSKRDALNQKLLNAGKSPMK